MIRRGRELLLAAAGVAVALALAEGALRLLPAPEGRGYAPISAHRARKTTNGRGYRDLERALDKPAGVGRVVSLGDSFAWGVGVDLDDAYPQRLERALTRLHGEPWQVVNLALPGMRSVDHAAVLEGEGLAYDPDLVLLGYVLNDAEDAAAAEARRAREWAEGGLGPEPSAWDRLALFRVVRTRLWATAQNRRRVTGYRELYAEGAPGWDNARAALMRIGDLCRARDLPLVIAIFPLFGNPLGEGYPFAAEHEKVRQAAAATGARVLDLLPAYRGLRWELLVVDGAADEHPNEVAHRIAANHILPVLREALERDPR